MTNPDQENDEFNERECNIVKRMDANHATLQKLRLVEALVSRTIAMNWREIFRLTCKGVGSEATTARKRDDLHFGFRDFYVHGKSYKRKLRVYQIACERDVIARQTLQNNPSTRRGESVMLISECIFVKINVMMSSNRFDEIIWSLTQMTAMRTMNNTMFLLIQLVDGIKLKIWYNNVYN